MKKVLLKRSASLVQGQPVLPTTSEIEYGELAVNYASGHETISMKNSNNQVVSFSSDEKFLDKVGLGHDEENDELYVRGLGGFTGDNYTTATSLQEVISDNEFVTAAALNELNNNKLDASAATGFMTSAQVETQITGKNYVTSAQVETQITGKNYATVSQIPNVGDYFDGAEYDSENVRINFKHGDTVKAYIDAAAFIKDGMVSNVYIDTPSAGTHADIDCLMVEFNTDAEKSIIEIPLSEIFDPSNYYSKSEVDGELDAVYGVIEDNEYVIATALNNLRDSKLDSSAATDFATTGQVETQITGKGYITGYTETDPTVPAWAKASSKPTYTASEVGALATGTTLDGIADGTTRKLSNYSLTSHTHSDYVTSAQVETQITGKNYATVSQLPEDILIARYGQPMTQEMLDSFLVPFDEDTNKPVLLKTDEGNVATYIGSIAGLGYTFCQAEASSEHQPKIYYYYYNESNQRWGSSSVTMSVSGHTHSNYMTSAQVESQITGKGYITGYTETDPTVPAWAKASSKPTYTASEVGAMASGTTLDGIADGTTRKLSNYSLTSHTHSEYATTADTANFITSADTGVKFYDISASTIDATGINDALPQGFRDLAISDISSGLTPVIRIHIDDDTLVMPLAVYSNDELLFSCSYYNQIYTFTLNNRGRPSYAEYWMPSESTISASGFTKNGITGINYNGTAVTISNGVANITAPEGLPAVTSADNGKVLQVVNGAWALVTPSTVYTGENTPPSSIGNDGDIYLQTD